MAETKKTTKAAPKKTTSRITSKPAGKKISVTVETLVSHYFHVTEIGCWLDAVRKIWIVF